MVAPSIAAMTLAAAVTTASARMPHAHPLHTTLTEISVDGARHTVRATVRLFVDDLMAALAKHPALKGADVNERGAAYVASALAFSIGGQPLAMRACGVRRSGDLLWVCFEGAITAAPAQLRARNPLLVEAFDDQVNVVQIGDGRSRRSVLFLKGDGEKPL